MSAEDGDPSLDDDEPKKSSKPSANPFKNLADKTASAYNRHIDPILQKRNDAYKEKHEPDLDKQANFGDKVHAWQKDVNPFSLRRMTYGAIQMGFNTIRMAGAGLGMLGAAFSGRRSKESEKAFVSAGKNFLEGFSRVVSPITSCLAIAGKACDTVARIPKLFADSIDEAWNATNNIQSKGLRIFAKACLALPKVVSWSCRVAETGLSACSALFSAPAALLSAALPKSAAHQGAMSDLNHLVDAAKKTGIPGVISAMAQGVKAWRQNIKQDQKQTSSELSASSEKHNKSPRAHAPNQDATRQAKNIKQSLTGHQATAAEPPHSHHSSKSRGRDLS